MSAADGQPVRTTPSRAAIGALLRKELLLERKVPQVVPAMGLFSVTTFVIFHFGLDQRTVEGSLAAGVLSVTLLFAAMLGANRLFVSDKEEGGFDALLLAPVDRTSLFVAKVLGFLAFLVVLEVVMLPAFAVLLLGPTPSAGEWLQLVGILALADLGIAVIGALVGALSIQTRARDLILPLIALPLLVPVIICLANGIAPLLTQEGATAVAGRWPAVLALYDLIFGLLAYAVFDFLLDD
ncbi:MAG: heme exporter protein CcmB [Baekduiaceae bacterium]